MQQNKGFGMLPASHCFLLGLIVPLSCLTHIINLATQAFLSKYSKSKHFEPEKPDQDLLSETSCHDEVGLLRTIAAKVNPLEHITSLFTHALY